MTLRIRLVTAMSLLALAALPALLAVVLGPFIGWRLAVVVAVGWLVLSALSGVAWARMARERRRR